MIKRLTRQRYWQYLVLRVAGFTFLLLGLFAPALTFWLRLPPDRWGIGILSMMGLGLILLFWGAAGESVAREGYFLKTVRSKLPWQGYTSQYSRSQLRKIELFALVARSINTTGHYGRWILYAQEARDHFLRVEIDELRFYDIAQVDINRVLEAVKEAHDQIRLELKASITS